jgi:hypothetical protein
MWPDQRRLPAVRSSREFWLWLGGLFLTLFAFFTAVAIAYFAKGRDYSLLVNGWMLGALLTFLAGFASLFGAIMSWPVPLPVVAAPGRQDFPAIEVEIFGISAIDTQRESDSGLAVPARLRSITALLRSRETERVARIDALLYVRLVPGSWGRVGEAVCPAPDWPLPPSLGLNPVRMPVDLAPGAEVSGQLVYEIPGYYLDKIAEPMSARLELWDHVTDKRMTLPAEIGNHDQSRMVPSSGSAEILGPEYEGTDQQDDPQQASA